MAVIWKRLATPTLAGRRFRNMEDLECRGLDLKAQAWKVFCRSWRVQMDKVETESK